MENGRRENAMPNMISDPGLAGSMNFDLEHSVTVRTELAELPKQIHFKERVHLWLTIRVSPLSLILCYSN